MTTRKFTVRSAICACLTDDSQIYEGIYTWVRLASSLMANSIHTYILRKSGIRRMISPTKGNAPLSILELDLQSGRFLEDSIPKEMIRRGLIVDEDFDWRRRELGTMEKMVKSNHKEYSEEIQAGLQWIIDNLHPANIETPGDFYIKFVNTTNITFNIKNVIKFAKEYPDEVDTSKSFLWFCSIDWLILKINRIRILNKIGKSYPDLRKLLQFEKRDTLIDNERCLDYIDPDDDAWFNTPFYKVAEILDKIFDYDRSSQVIEGVYAYKCYTMEEAELEVMNHDDLYHKLSNPAENKHNPYIIYPEAFSADEQISYMAKQEAIELYQYGFWGNFGYVPRIINTIANVNPMDPLTNFDGKKLKLLLEQFNDTTLAVKSMYLVGCETSKDAGPKIMDIVFTNNHPDEFVRDYPHVLNWMIKNKNGAGKLLSKVMASAKLLPDDISEMSIADMNNFLISSKGREEMELAEEEYDFRFKDCKFELPQLINVVGRYKSKLLEAGDYSMATIGYDTNCCQHMGGAGETSMIYGITAPKAGFWVCHKNTKTAEIEAQAVVWHGKLKPKKVDIAASLSTQEVLVFDNIEYANDGDIDRIYDVLKDWVEKYPYKNIAMGTGYNQTKFTDLFPECEYKLRMSKSPVIKRGDVYTDAQKAVWLKKDGLVMMK